MDTFEPNLSASDTTAGVLGHNPGSPDSMTRGGTSRKRLCGPNPFEAPIRGVNPFAAPMAPPEPDTSEPATHQANHTRSTNHFIASAMRMRHRSQNVAMSQQSDDPVPAAQPSG
jgi:hypothetical protein